MTICISVMTEAGIVLAGDGRSLQMQDIQNTNPRDTSQPLAFTIASDNEPKVHLIADRFAIAYSGVSNTQGWCLQQSINELDRLMRLNVRTNRNFDPRCGGEILDDLINEALCGIKFQRDFVWAGHDLRGRAFQTAHRDGRNITQEMDVPCGYREDIQGYPNGYFHWGQVLFGRAEVIEKLLEGRVIRWDEMNLRDIIEAVEWLLMTGTGGLRFLDGEQATSGGRVDIIALSPMWKRGKWVKNKTLCLFGEGRENIDEA